MKVKEDFLWGAASAAHQIEGAAKEDGKGPGIWDYFEQQEGRIAHRETAAVACDHYHRYKEDVQLMKKMGLKSYRFSISWPRVLPDGTGAVNQKGIQFYSDLVEELLKEGIEPIVTLYHWNLPMALFLQGGWKNEQMPQWFGAYTKAVVDALSDRVTYWITFNEFQTFAGGGLRAGIHAPFERNDTETMMKISKNLFLSHGTAVSVIRKYAKKPPKIGLAPTGSVFLPEKETKEEIEKARKKTFEIDNRIFPFTNAWWSDPILLGRFPEGAEELFGEQMLTFTEQEWALVSQKLDFYGFNVYQAQTEFGPPAATYDPYSYQGSPKTMTGWNVTPTVLYWACRFFYERYGLPLLITENGMAGMDWVSMDGKVHDYQRIDFIGRYLKELFRAMEEGIPVLGYQYWSVMDNFEWTEGFEKRFGLIYVDYQTGNRIIKDSGKFYKKVIETNGQILDAIKEERSGEGFAKAGEIDM